MVIELEKLRGRRVLITGHTGFKGKWLCSILLEYDVEIAGISREDELKDDFIKNFRSSSIKNYWVDLIDYLSVADIVKEFQPEFCFHMAAQPLVNYAYENPIETYQSNVMGTQSLLEAFKLFNDIQCTIVVITTDKVYRDSQNNYPYKENDILGGKDPYSSSKACVELLIRSYRESYFSKSKSHRLVSARAGNVIGPFDFTEGRIVPDFFSDQKILRLRFPDAVRPWQHVLEPLFGYIKYALFVSINDNYPTELNFGPFNNNTMSVLELVQGLQKYKSIEIDSEGSDEAKSKETKLLTLDNSLAIKTIGWKPKWNIEFTLKYTADGYMSKNNMRNVMKRQIDAYTFD
tara:strand:- start:1144 stop:2184 length:1041 start_codon:yes stop_codon:yes gene_type:complete